MMKKVRFFFVAVLMAVCTRAAADDYAFLTISGQDSEMSFEVSSIGKITFDATNMTLHLTNGQTRQMALAGLSKMFFTDSNTAGIASARTDEHKMSLEGGTLKVQAKGGVHIAIYNAGGTLVKSFDTNDEKAEIRLDGLAKGAYIVKVNGEAKKWLNK